MSPQPALRNLAIIAHVDHGKTTLIDQLLKQSGGVRANAQLTERAMDQGDLERERGITILAKCTSVMWENHRLNIVDTPGHADFGGEVERILSMVDGVLLLVDAAEGPMPQTKFVTQKALEIGLRPIVVINKADKPDARPDWVVDQVFDVFVALEASAEQLDFPVLYASAKEGWAVDDLEKPRDSLAVLFATILRHIGPPAIQPHSPFKMLATLLESDPFLGRVLTGRIVSGTAKTGMQIKALDQDHGTVETARLTKLLAFRGLKRVAVTEAVSGDIITIAGMNKATVAHTLCDVAVTQAIPARPISPPTMAMTISVNSSPLAGLDGDKLTAPMLKERLLREAESNIAIRVSEADQKDSIELAGRGELQLGILIETLRREGFEMTIGPPRVLFSQDQNGNRLEPIEEAVIDVDEAFSGVVVEKLSLRKGEMTEMKPSGQGKMRLVFSIPARGLVGYQSEFLTDTRGAGTLSRLFSHYGPYRGGLPQRRQGVLISSEQGKAVAYALWNLEDRGAIFIDPGEQVYQGMIIGLHSKGSDLPVNPLKGKQLTNIRAAGKDEAVRLTPPLKHTLEQAISFIAADEQVEVTPNHIRLRKAILDPHLRKRQKKHAEAPT